MPLHSKARLSGRIAIIGDLHLGKTFLAVEPSVRVVRAVEVWRDVLGHSDYEVSNTGLVRRRHQHGRSHKDCPAGSLIKRNQWGTSGYLFVSLYLPTRHTNRSFLVHLLVARAFLGEPLLGHEVNHVDGVKTNCGLSNLEYVTKSENAEHACAMGLRPTGERHRFCRATADLVRKVRGLGKCRASRELAISSGFSYWWWHDVVNFKCWRWLCAA